MLTVRVDGNLPVSVLRQIESATREFPGEGALTLLIGRRRITLSGVAAEDPLLTGRLFDIITRAEGEAMITAGDRGTVTIRIAGPTMPGEVEVRTPGGSRLVVAYATEEIPRGTAVLIYDLRPDGVEVTRADS